MPQYIALHTVMAFDISRTRNSSITAIPCLWDISGMFIFSFEIKNLFSNLQIDLWFLEVGLLSAL